MINYPEWHRLLLGDHKVLTNKPIGKKIYGLLDTGIGGISANLSAF